MKLKERDYLLLAGAAALVMSRKPSPPKAPIPVVLVPPNQVSPQGGFDNEDFNRGLWTGLATASIGIYTWNRWIKPRASKLLSGGGSTYASRYGYGA